MEELVANWDLLTKAPLAVILLIYIYLSNKNISKLIDKLISLIDKLSERKNK